MSLYTLAQQGDPEALSALVRQHIPLVQALCRRFSGSEDAFQQGCMGLVKAIRKYREDSGCQFSTYAVPVILGEMRRAYSHTLGWRSRAALNRAKAYQERTLRLTGQDPPIMEIAANAGVSPEELAMLIERDKGPVYDETGLLLPSLPDPRGDAWLTGLLIRDILDRMNPLESWLIRQRCCFMVSQARLARRLHVTQSAVSRKEKAARNHFRAAWTEADQS